MQKTFCDLCSQEFKKDGLGGGIMRNKEVYPIMPVPGAIVGPTGQPSQIIQKRIIPEIWDLCEACQKWVWVLAEKRKEELQKKAKEFQALSPKKSPESTLIKKP